MRIATVVAFAVLAWGLVGEAAPRVQHEGAIEFVPPAGWSRQVVNGQPQYLARDQGGAFSVGASKACASVNKEADAMLQSLGALPEFRQEARNGGKHIATGGQWIAFSYSFADASRPGRFVYGWQALVGAGGRSVAISAIFREAADFNRHTPELGRMVDGIKITSAMVIEPGNPPLTRFAVDCTEDFLEWLMQAPLTEAQKQTVEAELRDSWRKNDRSEIDGLGKIIETRDQLAALSPEKRELAREAILEAAVNEWRKSPQTAGARMMLEIYDCSHKPIAPGAPALTRQSVDAFAEMLCFAAGQTAGVTCAPPAEVKAKLADAVAAGYEKLTPDQQQQIARMPLAWAALRVAWPDLPDDQKQQCIQSWKNDANLVQLGQVLRGQDAASPAGAPQTVSSNNPKDAASAMQALQRQQMMYQTLSNCMRMQHETNQIIINNMGGGNTYRYEYRWR